MEIILTNKNSELLIFEGYAYIKHRTLADNSLSWRCGQSSWNGRVRTKDDSIEIVKNHCHFPDPADIEKRKIRKTLKDRAAVSDVTPRQTIFAAQRDVNWETAVHLPSYSANQQAVNRVRREKRPKMAEPTSLTGFDLPLALQKTHDGEQFLFHDSGPQYENRVIVFATLPGLDLLSSSDDWFCDGTFSTAPNVFYQIYTIHASIEGCLIPIVYALLPDKKESTYCRLLSILKVDSPKRVTIDFEVAVRNSIIATHQSAQIQFCFFHMSQSVWRHVQSSGNTHNYNSDLNFRELIRMLLATAFLPVEDVPTAFELLQGMASEESQPIFNYFEDTYIGRLTSQGRQKPRFDMEQWSCHQRVRNDLPRTNNAVESWNSNFVKLVNGKHP